MNTAKKLSAIAAAVVIVVIGLAVASPLLIPTVSTSSSTHSVPTSTSTSMSLPAPPPPANSSTSSTQRSTTSQSTDSTVVDNATVTVYARRVPSIHWAPCFALVCSAGKGPGATMFFALYNSLGNLVSTGFANENGYNFTGLTPHATYYVNPDDCDFCHNSPHDVNFSHWGDNSTVRPRAVIAGAALIAWFKFVPLNCTTSSTTTSQTTASSTNSSSETSTTSSSTSTQSLTTSSTSTSTCNYGYVAFTPEGSLPAFAISGVVIIGIVFIAKRDF